MICVPDPEYTAIFQCNIRSLYLPKYVTRWIRTYRVVFPLLSQMDSQLLLIVRMLLKPSKIHVTILPSLLSGILLSEITCYDVLRRLFIEYSTFRVSVIHNFPYSCDPFSIPFSFSVDAFRPRVSLIFN